jgi:AcrR family transcriptional regulator
MLMTEKTEGGNSITMVDLKQRTKVAAIDLGKYRRPHGIDFDPASGHVLVHRYFGSRLDLLSEVAHRLAGQLVESLNGDLETFQDVSVTPVDYLGSFARHTGIIRKRALVINELALHGASPALHSEDTRKILDSLQQIFELVEIPTRAARATALNMLTLVSVEVTLSEWMGVTAEERHDLRRLTQLELGFASQISKILGWE